MKHRSASIASYYSKRSPVETRGRGTNQGPSNHNRQDTSALEVLFRELSHDSKSVEVGWVGLGWDVPIQMCYSVHPFESSPFELADFLSCQRATGWGFGSPTPTLRIVVRLGWAPCYLNLSWNMVLEDTRIQFCGTSEYIRATKVFCQSRTTKN